MSRATCLAVALAAMAVGALPALAQEPVPTVDQATAWSVGPPASLGPRTTARPSRRATRIRVAYTVGACGNPRLADTIVDRRRDRIVVTVVVRYDRPATEEPCIAIAIGRTVGVDLGGRLGRRAVFDGSSDPPQRRIAVPPRRR